MNIWVKCFVLSFVSLALAVIAFWAVNRFFLKGKRKISFTYFALAGSFAAAAHLFYPIFSAQGTTEVEAVAAGLLSVFNSIRALTFGCEFSLVEENMATCAESFGTWYRLWFAVLFILAPISTVSFILTMFKNFSSYAKMLFSYFEDVYVFSELNDRSLALANDLKNHHKNALIIFTDVFEGNDENTYELIERSKKMGAISFKKDILVLSLKCHSKKAAITFFTIGIDETENLNHSLRLIEIYKNRENTRIYTFSSRAESELVLSSVDTGKLKVRRISEIQSLIYRLLYEQGQVLFESAKKTDDKNGVISAVIVGMGKHGTEMLKALAWFGQMDGYTLKINAFDKDPLAEEKFVALAPELMSPEYNGVSVEGEAQYKINIHSGIDVDTISFTNEISRITDATYIIVSLGNDDINIKTAIKLRMYFERMKIHPVIKAIVYNSAQKNALNGIRNFRGEEYDIEFIGDGDSSYTEAVIVDSELEDDALRRHLKWGKEEDFWAYEYCYRSSVASAIHMKARKACRIPGADKKEDELTAAERDIIEVLEHRRWNAYMRSEGYIFSGSKDKASRNDLAKMHHDLVDFSSLSEEDKRKDSKVGTD